MGGRRGGEVFFSVLCSCIAEQTIGTHRWESLVKERAWAL